MNLPPPRTALGNDANSCCCRATWTRKSTRFRNSCRPACRIAGSVRAAQSLSWQARRCLEGALADLLLVDGHPLQDIKLIEDSSKNFLVIMKDGKIYKKSRGT